MNQDFIYALVGGAIIGFATVLLMHFNGRVTGISGIINGAFKYVANDWTWRIVFIVGLFTGGLVMKWLRPEGFVDSSQNGWMITMIAGILVGFGTIMGSGCTSGHGVCGISRLSIRSIVATLTFIAAGIVAVALKHYFIQ